MFLLDTDDGAYHLIFNNWNNGIQLPDYDIIADRDYFFYLDEGGVTEIVISGIENLNEAKQAIVMRGNEATFPGLIDVYNINGQRVESGNGRVTLETLPSGIYIVRGVKGNQVDVLKIIR